MNNTVGWFTRTKKKTIADKVQKKPGPDGLWVRCEKCKEMVYKEELVKNFYVCSKCNYHFRIDIKTRISIFVDENSFQEFGRDITASDPLKFIDGETSYSEKLKITQNKTEYPEAVRTGIATLNKIKIILCILDFNFFGGSMGSVVGEKITKACEKAVQLKHPLVIISASGGARMQEGVLSLMQMIKTSSALANLAHNRIPYISILTDPTTGGVSASFAMLGDIIMAEPGALIGFAGPRVIEQTIKQKLPPGFQRSEFLLEHGFVDLIINRKDLKSTTVQLLKYLWGKKC